MSLRILACIFAFTTVSACSESFVRTGVDPYRISVLDTRYRAHEIQERDVIVIGYLRATSRGIWLFFSEETAILDDKVHAIRIFLTDIDSTFMLSRCGEGASMVLGKFTDSAPFDYFVIVPTEISKQFGANGIDESVSESFCWNSNLEIPSEDLDKILKTTS